MAGKNIVVCLRTLLREQAQAVELQKPRRFFIRHGINEKNARGPGMLRTRDPGIRPGMNIFEDDGYKFNV